jgi:copper transporter 1
MLWNWYTIDACFVSKSWHITSKGMFAGSCIGVILLVMVLEGLRRASREFDAYILREAAKKAVSAPATTSSDRGSDVSRDKNAATAGLVSVRATLPTIPQQAIRAFLHMCQFAVAYIVMLLAMYYNGYIIICIFIGAYIGSFIFSWHPLGGGQPGEGREVTYCCG